MKSTHFQRDFNRLKTFRKAFTMKTSSENIIRVSNQKCKIDCKAKLLRKEGNAMCFLDQHGVTWFELLEPGETVGGPRYQHQLPDLNRSVR